MSESVSAPAGVSVRRRLASWWVSAACLAGIVALVMVSLLLAPRPEKEGEAFGGTDSAVTDVLAERGVQQWMTPIFEPGSGEVESGLFALQAALGAGIFGYAVGRLHGRRRGQPGGAESTGGHD
ncbi:Cobalt transport protein CbiN [Austwickia sp. TVS 96-490-7B]|uniref:energy-coupling factor ABC transporter substrate-binding protein n=1 Tax=Austwickia sp. TVS 96-490-7B TaxID=2830843 RepID=UPI001C59CED3|nr:energy-coupling factor ABC transporter substrate-binding protein [Austwickia sp. TVS 96-490-7B]MBW3084946.1 Cobalt transport protein CbiN [Austwickia sp. TVS 96-490-7B]